MRLTRDYVFELIDRFGREVAQATPKDGGMWVVGSDLGHLARKLAQRRISPTEVVVQLVELADIAARAGVSSSWKYIFRRLADEADAA